MSKPSNKAPGFREAFPGWRIVRNAKRRRTLEKRGDYCRWTEEWGYIWKPKGGNQ